MREGGLGTAACYLTVERLALQAGVESPFWDETSLLMGGCDEPWYKKPLTPRRLRSFLKRYGGSLPDDDGQRGHAASVFADVMRLHGIPMEDGADDLGALDPDAEPDDLYDEDEEEYFIGRFEEERYAGMDDSYYDICKEVAFLCEAYAQYLCKSYGIA